MAPELNRVSCVNEFICLEDISRFKEAKDLYNEAYKFVNSKIDKINKTPRIIFCSSKICFQSFGFNKSSAQTVGTAGIVVNPIGWKDYYVRHEMIHHLQAERLGLLKYQFAPNWFKERMAYSHSKDPRSQLSETYEEYRKKFNEWDKSIEKKNFWEETKRIK